MMNYAQVIEQTEQLKTGKKVPDIEKILKEFDFLKILCVPASYEGDFLGEYIESILKEHKISVARFNPYGIQSPLGYIRYNGKNISKNDFAKYGEMVLLNEIGERYDEHFEIDMYLKIALKYFYEKKPEVLIVPSYTNAEDNKDIPLTEKENTQIETMILGLKRQIPGLEDKKIEKAYKKCKFEGRYEIIKKKPYFLCDGADDGENVKLLMAKLQHDYPNNPYCFIVGALKDGYEEIVKESAMMAQQILTVTPPECKAALPALDLAYEYGKYNSNITNTSSIEEAVEIAEMLSGKETVTVAFGTTKILEKYKKAVLREKLKR